MRLEVGPSHQPCLVCGGAIGERALCIVDTGGESPAHDMYRHLVCSIDHGRHYVHAALTRQDIAPDLLARARAEVMPIDAALVAEVTAFRAMHYPEPIVRTTNLDDPRTRALLALLAATPDDRALYEVLGDHLQQLGDDRGELIALDLAAPSDLAALSRRRALARALAPPLPPQTPWSYGFIRSLDLEVQRSLEEHRTALAHPACRLLQALCINTLARRLDAADDLFPRSLRELRVYARLTARLDDLPHLSTLVVNGGEGVAHPTVRTLALGAPTARALARAAIAFPSVTWLAIYECPVATVRTLDAAGWLDRLRGLELTKVELSESDASRLAEVPGLAVTLFDAGPHAARFRAVTVPPPRRVTHVTRPEWGTGTIVREYDGKLDVAFETGTRTFRADTPILVPFDG